ncbi:MAG: DnaJ domain-containing protein [Cyclobacteriaceae bacterium]|nr:DnaJ domain-containing protein [Cyclobacteriaceae bacterium]
MMSKNYYEILEIPLSSNQDEIKKAYRQLAFKYHPDKNLDQSDADKIFAEINEAYSVLSDPDLKARYDFKLFYGFDYALLESHVNEVTEVNRRPHPPAYYRQAHHYEKQEYTRTAYILSGLSVVLLIGLVTGFSYFMLKTTSERDFQKGVGYFRMGDHYTALALLKRSVREFGENNDLALMLSGKIYADYIQNYESAIKSFEKALKYKPNDSLINEIYYFKGKCYNELKEFEQAITYFERVDPLSCKSDSAMYQAALIQTLKLGLYDQALAKFQALLKQNENFNDARFYLAQIFQAREMHSEALREYEKLLTQKYNTGMVHFLAALSEIKNGNMENACSHLDLSISSGYSEARPLRKMHCPGKPFPLNP